MTAAEFEGTPRRQGLTQRPRGSRYKQLEIQEWLGDTAEDSVLEGTELDWQTDTATWPDFAVSINSKSIHERLYALNWLVFDKNADWDDISNDS